MAEPMFQDDFADRPALPNVRFDLRHLLLGHRGIGFVVEGNGDAVARQVAHGAEKHHQRPTIAAADLFGEGMKVNSVTGEPDHGVVFFV